MISSTVTLSSLSSAQVLGGTTVRAAALAKSQNDRPAWARAQAPWPFRVATPFGPSVALNAANATATV